jgi:hypothetical protein
MANETLALTGCRWIVVRKREIDPPEVYPFAREDDARAFHDRAQQQWSDCYLTRVVMHGMRQIQQPSDTTETLRARAEQTARECRERPDVLWQALAVAQQIEPLLAALATASTDAATAQRTFPIQQGRRGDPPHPTRIPWSVADKAYSVYSAHYGSDQTLERLAERGGFGWEEMDRFYPPWRNEVSEIEKWRQIAATAQQERDELRAREKRLARANWVPDFLLREAEQRADAAEASVQTFIKAAELNKQAWEAAEAHSREYGQHKPDCHVSRCETIHFDAADCRCTCGFDTLLAAVETLRELENVVRVARDFVRYYLTGPDSRRSPSTEPGCANCGGLPHSDTCFVGRFEKALADPPLSEGVPPETKASV